MWLLLPVLGMPCSCHTGTVRPPVGAAPAQSQESAKPEAPSAAPMVHAMPPRAETHPPHDHGARPEGVDEVKLGILDGEQSPNAGKRVICPVCGDEFTVSESSPVRHYRGKSLVFCCDRCLPHFDKNPEMILNQ